MDLKFNPSNKSNGFKINPSNKSDGFKINPGLRLETVCIQHF